MSSEPQLTNVNIELENTNELRWIMGNLFFTSMILCIAIIQMYIYYQHDIDKKCLFCNILYYFNWFTRC